MPEKNKKLMVNQNQLQKLYYYFVLIVPFSFCRLFSTILPKCNEKAYNIVIIQLSRYKSNQIKRSLLGSLCLTKFHHSGFMELQR
nr:hypothetical protein [Tanacetum cinerariifolium]